MAKVARNALKGYTYQTYILTVFLALMDTERKICKLESESLETKQFDDISAETIDKDTYRIQVKNYPKATIDDITITDHIVTICGNSNRYDPNDINIMVVNTEHISTDTVFMGIPATIKDGITIIPFTPAMVENYLDSIFQNESRELQVILKAYEFTSAAKFTITVDDLPELITLSTDLSQNTILLRNVPQQFDKGVTLIIGKPGVGKSHYVDELTKVHEEAIIYRFWINAQDEHLSYRLQYNAFLIDLGLKVFKSPKAFNEHELIEKMKADNRLIIIDGLDHVENYNPQELSNYLMLFELLEKEKVKTVILSRPMKANLPWNSIELTNWNFSETQIYLASAHNIYEYDVQKRIYDYANGYPIITCFYAEHFKYYGDFNPQIAVSNINDYYDELLKSVGTKSALCVFATNNSFFTRNELRDFFSDPEAYDTLMEFIETFPYLFECVQNRISLVHDSLNTYLRCILTSYPQRLESVRAIVQKSLKDYEVEYMSRLFAFHFEEDFLKQLLRQYSDFGALKKLFATTIDFDSIASFYQQLRRILEKCKETLDLYQYYSFVLIYQVVTRNDLFGYEGLVYQILLYVHKHSNIVDSIFSSGIMWNVYLLCSERGDLTERFIEDSLYGNFQFGTMIETLEAEVNFFNCLKQETDRYAILELIKTTENGQLEKSDLLKEYLVSASLHGMECDELKHEFEVYLNTSDISLLKAKLHGLDIEDYFIERAIKGAEYQLKELGVGGKSNMFRSSSLMGIIEKYAPDGSFETSNIAHSYLRLANYENRSVDINSINYLWSMYAQRKDYSVHTLDRALILFEEQGLLKEEESIEILNRLIEQSEKGIRLLLTSYVNTKGIECTIRLVESGRLFTKDFNVDIFDLSPENLNCLPKWCISSRTMRLLYYHRYTKSIDVSDLENVLLSNYCEYVLEILHTHNYSFTGTTNEEIAKRIKAAGVNTSELSSIQEKEYIPFEHGCIHEKDLTYIQENHIPLIECVRYADGWHHCMPFLSLFEEQDASLLKENYLNLLHESIYAKVVEGRYIGDWYNLIGNIPKYLKICDIDLSWAKMLGILKEFFDCSLIYYPEINEDAEIEESP